MADVQIVEWHPYAKTFPILEGEEYIEFRESFRAGGQDKPILARLANGRVQGLDGQNRHKACLDVGIPPLIEMVRVDDDKVVDYIDRQNTLRRHMTKESRQARVEYLRSEGHSVREIAERVGASVGTVHKDLEESPVQNRTPAKVTGADGKSYPAAKPIDPAKLCARCARNVRTGKKPVKACIDCKDIARLANGEREPGDDTEEEVKAARAEKTKKKPGSVLFDWKQFDALYKQLPLELDNLYRAYGKKNGSQIAQDPAYHGMLRLLKEFVVAFVKRYEELSKTKAPAKYRGQLK